MMKRIPLNQQSPFYSLRLLFRGPLAAHLDRAINRSNLLEQSDSAPQVKVTQLDTHTVSIEFIGSIGQTLLDKGPMVLTSALASHNKLASMVLSNPRLAPDGNAVLYDCEDSSANYAIRFTSYASLIDQNGDLRLDSRPGNVWKWRTNPHALISGKSGSGKSYALSIFLRALSTLQPAPIFVGIDVKYAELTQLMGELDGAIANTPDDALKYLQTVADEISRRQQAPNDFPPLFLVMEEMAATLTLMNAKQKAIFMKLYKQILVLGRSANVHVILVVQAATAENVGGIEGRAQFSGFRLLLKPQTKEELGFLFPGVEAVQMGIGHGLIALDGVPGTRRLDVPIKLD